MARGQNKCLEVGVRGERLPAAAMSGRRITSLPAWDSELQEGSKELKEQVTLYFDACF